MIGFVEGALGGRIEFADVFEFVSKPIEAHRQFCGNCKDVYDIAAPAPLAFHFHLGDALIAHFGEFMAELF